MRDSITSDTGLEKSIDSVSVVRVGNHLFTSGVAPDRSGGIESQARQIFQRVAGLLHDAGSSLDDVVRARFFFVDPGTEGALRSVQRGIFAGRGPALTALQVSCLPHGVRLVGEFEAIVGARDSARRSGIAEEWGACAALRVGPEIFVSGLTTEWPGLADETPSHDDQVGKVCGAATRLVAELGAGLSDVVATRHFDPASVHRHSFQGDALETFKTPGDPTSAGITVEGTGGSSTFMLEAEAVVGAAGTRKNLRTGRTFEVEHHYSRSVRVGQIVYVAGSTSIVVGETVRHPGEVYGQVTDTLETIRATIEGQGLAWSDLVRTRSYIVGGPAKLDEAINALKTVVGGMGAVATVVGVPVLGRPEVVVEIEATALRSAS